MKPILYEGTATTFLNNGLGRLSDAISCKVTEERNGTFELEMTYPITGIHYSDIAENRIILAKTEDGGNNQAFIIYKISKPLNGIITINAQHISYLLNGYVVMPFNAVSLADAMGKINTYAVLTTGFTFTTDIISTTAFELSSPRNIRNLLGGESGSLLDVYGGHDYKFDNFNVSLLADRGADNGVTIRYGKNLTDLKSVDNTTNVYTGIVPFWADSEGNKVYIDGYVLYSEYAATYPHKYIKVVDFSSEFETQPTQAQLLAKAESYLNNNEGWKIKRSIDVSFISLAQTEEYKDIAPLEHVKMCDTVTVQYTALGISFKTKVIKTVYDVLTEKYDSISLGDTTYTLAKALQEVSNATTMAETNSAIQAAVTRATNLIRGGLGGHVVMRADGDGLPQEILIMDTDDITTAQKVWRWNLNGLGYSNTGYDGEYGTAITMDGQIVANYITAGTFDGALIRANTVSANALSLQAKEDLGTIHSYIEKDLSLIASWQWRPIADGTVSIASIDGDSCLALNGSSLANFDEQYYAQTTMAGFTGSPTFTITFKQRFDRNVSITRQRSFFVYYYCSADNLYYTFTDYISGDFEAGQWYEFSFTYTLPVKSDTLNFTPQFGLYHVPGAVRYIKDIKVNASIDNYATATMDFSLDGLRLAFEEISPDHDYLPYDTWDNIARWKNWYPDMTPDPEFRIEQNEKYAVLDGTGLTGYNDYVTVYFDSDYAGKVTVDLHIKIRVDTTFTITDSGFRFVSLRYYDEDNIFRVQSVITPSQGEVFEAGTVYTWNRNVTLSYAAYTRPQIHIAYIPGIELYIKEFTVTGKGDNYKSTQISVNPSGLSSVVQAGQIISTINQSAERLTIQASKIDLTGDLTLKGQFTAYDPNDLTNYIDMTEGEITVVNNGDVIFTIDSDPLIGSKPGIFFGDPEDSSQLERHTHIDNDMVTCPNLYARSTGDYESDFDTQSTDIVSMVCEGEANFYGGIIVKSDASQTGGVTNVNSFHNNTQFYGNVYNSSGGTVFVSDQRKKNSIENLAVDKARSFLMNLKARVFKFNGDISKSGRKHHGFIAQEVKQAMSEDWGVYVDDKEQDFIGLRYDEFIADMVAVIQDQQRRIEALERALNDKPNN